MTMRYKDCLRAIALCSFVFQLGCSAVAYRLASQPSLSKTRVFSGNKIYSLGDLLNSIALGDFEFDTYLFNTKTLRGYDTSLVVPIPTKQENSEIGSIGRKPFIINLRIRTKTEDATILPFLSELYLRRDEVAIRPSEVYTGTRNGDCGSSAILAKTVIHGSPVPILNKRNIIDAEGNEIDDWSILHWTCLQLRFDVETPDPSKSFRLKLGDISAPEGDHIRPMIYFSPVTYKMFLH